MFPSSTAYVLVQTLGYSYTFDGVTSISHSLNLKISTDSDSEGEADTVNNARNEPDVVTLSVVASDSHVAVAGWSKQTLRSLAQIKEYRLLCKVVTSLRTYENMLLSGINALQDETCPEGWSGTLTFTKTEPRAAAVKTENQSSTPVPTGTSSVRKVSKGSSSGAQGGSVLQTILKEAGIKLGT